MIRKILTYYAERLEEYLSRTHRQPEGIATVGLIGTASEETPNKLVVSLVNLEKEASGDGVYMQRASGGYAGRLAPLMLNMHIMLAAVYESKRYAESLSVLSDTLEFIQSMPKFSVDGAVYTIEVVPMSTMDLHNIWTTMGGQYHPSVICKVRGLTIDSGTVISGTFWLPEPDDEVLVGFVNNDPAHPVILGSIYGAKHKPPYEYTAENNMKALVTRKKLKIEFDEEKKIITVSTPGNNKVELNDEGKSVTLTDANGNEVKMDKDGISLSSAKDIKLSAKGNITMDATMKLSGSAKQDASLEGLNVTVQGKMGATVKGNATAELSASGQTTVKGAMVMIN